MLPVRPAEIGLVLPSDELGGGPAELVAYARLVEQLGFSDLVLFDHVVGVDRSMASGFTGPYDVTTKFHGSRS